MGGGKKGGEDDNGRCVYKYRLHCASSNSDTLLLPHLSPPPLSFPPPSSPLLLPPLPPPLLSPHSLLPWSRPPTPSLRPPHPPLTPSSSHPSSPAPPLTPYPPILHPPSTPTDYRFCVLACENSTIKVTARPSRHINSRMAISTY